MAQLRWKKTHGWIEPECSIDHPDIGKHQGIQGSCATVQVAHIPMVLVNEFADVGDAILHHGDSAMYEFFARSCQVCSASPAGWWFQTCFIFHFIWVVILPMDSYFSSLLKPPTSQINHQPLRFQIFSFLWPLDAVRSHLRAWRGHCAQVARFGRWVHGGVHPLLWRLGAELKAPYVLLWLLLLRRRTIRSYSGGPKFDEAISTQSQHERRSECPKTRCFNITSLWISLPCCG